MHGQVSRINADGSIDTYGGGTAKLSAATAVTTQNDGAADHAVAASVAPVQGAVGYAWFWGAPGSETLGAVTTINSLVITAPASGTQPATSLGANDNSTNNLVFNGLLSQIALPGSNAYLATMPTGTAGTGTPLTADGLGGIVEIDAALKHFWDNYRLSPTSIWVNSQEQGNITKKVLAGGQERRATVHHQHRTRKHCRRRHGDQRPAAPQTFRPDRSCSTPTFCLIPSLAWGTFCKSGAAADYYQMEWPVKTRRYEYGVYMDGVLQNYFPPASA